MKKTMHQLFAVLFSIVFLQGCGTEGSKKDGMASVGVKMPNHIAPKPISQKSISERPVTLTDSILSNDIWISGFEPLNNNDLNCFGVIVGDSGSVNAEGKKTCFINATAEAIDFENSAFGAGRGETVNLSVPAGAGKRFDVIAWKANSEGACDSLEDGTSVDVTNVSHPYLIGTLENVNLVSGPQDAPIVINANFDDTQKLIGCDIFQSNGAQAVLTTTISGTVTGLLAPEQVVGDPIDIGQEKSEATKLSEAVAIQITSEQAGSEILVLEQNGPFSFPTALNNGEAFNVSVISQPASVGCFVLNGNGVASGTIPEVEVICNNEQLVLEGSSSGMIGRPIDPLIIQVQQTRPIGDGSLIIESFPFSIDEDGFGPLLGFESPLRTGDQFNIEIVQQPTLHTCSLENASGIMSGSIFAEDSNSPRVTCQAEGFRVGGVVSGFESNRSSVLGIRMNSTFYGEEPLCREPDLQEIGSAGAYTTTTQEEGGITTQATQIQLGGPICANFAFISEDGSFFFNGLLPDGESFSLVIDEGLQPFGQTCSVVNVGVAANVGVINGADITNFQVECVNNTYQIDVAISNLSELEQGEITVVMNDGLDSITTGLNGTHPFTQKITHDDSLDVQVTSKPVGVSCDVSNGQIGFVTSDVTVGINCFLTPLNLGGNVSGLNAGESINVQIPSLSVAASDPTTGDFTFPVTFAVGDVVDMQIDPASVPAGFSCDFVNSNSVTFAGADILDVQIACVQTDFQISVIVQGIDGELGDGFVDVLNNTNEDFLNIVDNNVTTPFGQLVQDGTHTLEIFPGELSQCTFDANGLTTLDVVVAGADVTNIGITCTTEQPL